jgi:hypothetical protein
VPFLLVLFFHAWGSFTPTHNLQPIPACCGLLWLVQVHHFNMIGFSEVP